MREWRIGRVGALKVAELSAFLPEPGCVCRSARMYSEMHVNARTFITRIAHIL